MTPGSPTPGRESSYARQHGTAGRSVPGDLAPRRSYHTGAAGACPSGRSRRSRRCPECAGPGERRSPGFRLAAEHEGGVVFEDAAVAAGQGDVMPGHLPVTAVAAYLDDGFAERRETPHVVAGQLTAARVAGEVAARGQAAVLDEPPALSLGAEAVILERHENGVGVAVIELDEVDVLVSQPRPAQSLPAGGPCRGLQPPP